MARRGPDGKGEWVSPDARCGFGHRRLSIIDLSEGGAQPMANADGTLVVTFNGEIYNYRELRRSLEAKGYTFRSHSDTEVLLHLYADKGPDMAHDLRGMFAFAIWDGRKRQMFLARDPLGIKPLYYADDGRTFRFASQVKALLAGGGIDEARDPAGVVSFYLLGSLPEPLSLYKQIKALPAGHTMTVTSSGAAPPRRYPMRLPKSMPVPRRLRGSPSGPIATPVRAKHFWIVSDTTLSPTCPLARFSPQASIQAHWSA
ncbi:MAG: hypothetical protein R3D67_11935 [Hyphomicrobiaceae bacterium]